MSAPDVKNSLLNPDDETVRQIMAQAKTIAVIGWSDKEDRPSHEIADYLVKQGYHVIPVNPRLKGKLWNDETIYASLLDIPVPIDIVDVFRRPSFTPDHARQAVQADAGVFWLQLGIANDEAGQIALDGKLQFVQNRCLKTEHMRLIRGIPFPPPVD